MTAPRFTVTLNLVSVVTSSYRRSSRYSHSCTIPSRLQPCKQPQPRLRSQSCQKSQPSVCLASSLIQLQQLCQQEGPQLYHRQVGPQLCQQEGLQLCQQDGPQLCQQEGPQLCQQEGPGGRGRRGEREKVTAQLWITCNFPEVATSHSSS